MRLYTLAASAQLISAAVSPDVYEGKGSTAGPSYQYEQVRSEEPWKTMDRLKWFKKTNTLLNIPPLPHQMNLTSFQKSVLGVSLVVVAQPDGMEWLQDSWKLLKSWILIRFLNQAIKKPVDQVPEQQNSRKVADTLSLKNKETVGNSADEERAGADSVRIAHFQMDHQDFVVILDHKEDVLLVWLKLLGDHHSGIGLFGLVLGQIRV